MEQVTTTFWQDFTIADAFGQNAIKDTYERAFNGWKSDIRYIAELYIVLNHKIWQHFDKGNIKTSRLYNDLWEQLGSYVWSDEPRHYTQDELNFFYQVTD